MRPAIPHRYTAPAVVAAAAAVRRINPTGRGRSIRFKGTKGDHRAHEVAVRTDHDQVNVVGVPEDLVHFNDVRMVEFFKHFDLTKHQQ